MNPKTTAEAAAEIRRLADAHNLPVIIWQRGDILTEAAERGFRPEDAERIADYVEDSWYWASGVKDASTEAGWEPIYQGVIEAATDLKLGPAGEEELA